MTTVLIVGNSDGSRRCDARCHNAKSARCECICNGRYHGQGEEYALNRVLEDVKRMRFAADVEVHQG